MDYIERLTGMKTNELVEVSQDREAWRELVVAIYNRPTRERERERERCDVHLPHLNVTLMSHTTLRYVRNIARYAKIRLSSSM